MSFNSSVYSSPFKNNVIAILNNVSVEIPIEKGDESNFVWNAHLIRAVIGCVACLPNLFLILLCLSLKNLRTKINYMVCNLMAGNIFMCITLIAYSFIKYSNPIGPNDRFACLSLIWIMVFAGFAPVWGIIFVAFIRAMYYSSTQTVYHLLTTFRLVELRTAQFLIDLVMACFVLEEIDMMVSTDQCTYQSLISASKVYLYYCIVVILILLVTLTVCLINRTLLSRKFTARKGRMMSSSGTVHPYVPPLSICSRPCLLVVCIILVFLFTFPRVNLLLPHSEMFSIVASICPVVSAFILSLVFIFADVDMRFAIFTCVLPLKRVFHREKLTDPYSNFVLTIY